MPTTNTSNMQPAWHVRYAGATPERVLVEPAATNHPGDLHIVGIGPREHVSGRWGKTFYHAWEEALAATLAQQEAKIRQMEHDLAWNREHLAKLRTLTEPEQPQP